MVYFLESVWPMFSSKSFKVCGLISRSFIHLEFIFVYGVRECSNFSICAAEASTLLLFCFVVSSVYIFSE